MPESSQTAHNEQKKNRLPQAVRFFDIATKAYYPLGFLPIVGTILTPNGRNFSQGYALFLLTDPVWNYLDMIYQIVDGAKQHRDTQKIPWVQITSAAILFFTTTPGSVLATIGANQKGMGNVWWSAEGTFCAPFWLACIAFGFALSAGLSAVVKLFCEKKSISDIAGDSAGFVGALLGGLSNLPAIAGCVRKILAASIFFYAVAAVAKSHAIYSVHCKPSKENDESTWFTWVSDVSRTETQAMAGYNAFS